MKAAVIRNQSVVACPEGSPQSPEQSATATSGTYFRAVRPTQAEAAALARGEPLIDSAKVERLCSTIAANLWRADSRVVAERMLQEAGSEQGTAGDGVAGP